MLSFLGLKVNQPIINKQRYKEALQEIKHLLSFKQGFQLQQTEYIMVIAKGQYSLELVKNPCYLHNCHFNMPILHQQDFQFLDICYECLMIIRQSFPSKIQLQIVTENDSKQLQAFQERKQQEFNRRVNASLKSLIQSKVELDCDEIQDIMHLMMYNYNRKNKSSALKLLLNRLNAYNLGSYSSQYLEMLAKIQEENEFKKSAMELVTKIKALQREHNVNKQNLMRVSNVYRQDQNIKLNPLIFQLKESYNLERICSLLSTVLNKQNDRNFITKLQSSIVLITNRFITNQYDQISFYGAELAELMKIFWEKRGKKWEQGVRDEVQKKVREYNNNSRIVHSKTRSPFSRKLLS